LVRLETPAGRLFVVGAEPGRLEAVSSLVLRELGRNVIRDPHDAAKPRTHVGIERIDFAGTPAWFKRSFLRGRSRWRWSMRRVPRLREHDNLIWLARHSFQVPVPLAAGVLVRSGLPLWQFLITQDMTDVVTLESCLREGARTDRAELLDELARETARMHALGFVHHDLYPRNVLVRPAGQAHRIAFVDAWAGGPAPQLRSAEYDLACFFLRADRELEADEVQRFVDVYASERAARGRPVDARTVLERAKHIRTRLVRRLVARPHELRGETAPTLEW
jgi:tRNA A-37 threonylcarbamoyl transferase component Bud32